MNTELHDVPSPIDLQSPSDAQAWALRDAGYTEIQELLRQGGMVLHSAS